MAANTMEERIELLEKIIEKQGKRIQRLEYIAELVPAPPDPYQTFDQTFGYGPE